MGIVIQMCNREILAHFQADGSCSKNHTALNVFVYFRYHIVCERQSCIKLWQLSCSSLTSLDPTITATSRIPTSCHQAAHFYFQMGSRWAWCFPGEATLYNLNTFHWLQYFSQVHFQKEEENFHAWNWILKLSTSTKLVNALFNKYHFVNCSNTVFKIVMLPFQK